MKRASKMLAVMLSKPEIIPSKKMVLILLVLISSPNSWLMSIDDWSGGGWLMLSMAFAEMKMSRSFDDDLILLALEAMPSAAQIPSSRKMM